MAEGGKTDYGRRVSVSCADANTGEFVEWNQKNTNYYDFGQAGLSSGSIPVVFPPQVFQGATCMDGGTVWNTNIDSAINQCLDMGATREEITIDIVNVGGTNFNPTPEHEANNSIGNFMMARDLASYYKETMNMLEEVKGAPGINIRYYFRKGGMPCSMSQLNFNGEDTWCYQEAGRRDAQNMLAIGQEKIGLAVKQWSDSKALQKAYPFIGDYIEAL